MSRWVVDTNVPIVANGRPACRLAAINFLQQILGLGTIFVDLAGAIQAEYHSHLNPRGQPGVGDRFYLEILNSAPRTIERVDLPKRGDGEYAALPQALIDAGFDPGDRKFAALAKQQDAAVANATDSDWLEHRSILDDEKIKLHLVCGFDRSKWFANK